jgi:hypothetical protein
MTTNAYKLHSSSTLALSSISIYSISNILFNFNTDTDGISSRVKNALELTPGGDIASHAYKK